MTPSDDLLEGNEALAAALRRGGEFPVSEWARYVADSLAA